MGPLLIAQNDRRDFLRGISGAIQSAREQPLDLSLIIAGVMLFAVLIAVFIALQNKNRIRSLIIRIRKKMKGELIKTERFQIKRDVSLELPSTNDEIFRVRTSTIDLSKGGMFVKLNPPPSLDTAVSFHLFLKDNSPSISGTAQVVWIQNGWSEHHPTGVGLKFLDMTADNENQIRLWIQKNKPKKAK